MTTPERDYFYQLMNIELYPEFLPTAKIIADQFLKNAENLLNGKEVPEMLRRFSYSHAALDERLDKIYDLAIIERDKGLDRTTPVGENQFAFWTPQRLRWRLTQYAPFNLTDGAWLQNVSRAGTINNAQALLFSIWADEFGNGKDSQNHSNVYRDLLNSIGLYLHDTRSRSFADDPRFLDSAFTAPVFQLAISQYSTAYLPELIGMTLWLEWVSPPQMQLVVEMLKASNFNPHFYSLHVGIDNPVNGHGAFAKEITRLYLDEMRHSSGGEDAVQAHWVRIWNGFVAFQIAGTVGADLEETLKHPSTSEQRMIELIRRNAHFASQMHLGKALIDPRNKQTKSLNELFKDPEGLLIALVANNLVIPGNPEESRFLRLLEFDGPMYKVFSAGEIDLIKEWVLSLKPKVAPPVPVHPPIETAASAMAELVDRYRKIAVAEPAHANFKVRGPDPSDPNEAREEPWSWWLQLSNALTSQAMMALAEDKRYVVRGRPEESPLITNYLAPTHPMAITLGQENVEIIRAWIAAGAPPPELEDKVTVYAVFMDTELPRAAADPSQKKRILGMGVVH